MKKFFAILLAAVLLAVVSSEGFAAKYDIKELTPEVKSALDSRRGRFDQLRQLKEQGIVGENNKGYVEVLQDNAEAKGLVEAENRDRKFIYQTIVKQNNLPSDALATVEEVFAQVQRDKAASGDKIQNADGQWVTK